jgi:crotonobetainyl-CoA:carnitine CoA-transferase CaiB-like acyl-CoA transferase
MELGNRGNVMADNPIAYRVLNLARGVAGAYATRLLSDLGAQCSWWLWDDPRPGDWPENASFRAYFEQRVECLNSRVPLVALLQRLPGVAGAFDLVVSDFSANEVPEEQLLDLLRPFNPSIVVANADHFGRTGPYAQWTGDELTDYAMGGYWTLAGDPDKAPLRVPGHQAQFHAGMQLALAALAALRHARLTGEGQEIEVTGIEAMLGAHWSSTVAWTHEGRILKRLGSDLFKASDGWVFFFRLGLYPNLFILIEQPELMDDPRWSTITNWLANAPQLWAMVEDWCKSRSMEEIVSAAQQLRIPATPVDTAATLLADEGLKQRGFFDFSSGGGLPGQPYRWSNDWPQATDAPSLSQALANPSAVEVAAPVPETSRGALTTGGPLAGLKAIEVTNNWAGPIAGRHLGDLGADVLKIELATKPATRLSHYPGKDPGKYHWNRSGYFNEMNRNKRDLSLNLATDRGREIFLELVRGVDVVVENNSARVMPNLGLGYQQLSEVNPKLVMASISGFGATGPRKDWVAFGSNIETACGLAAITGYVDAAPQRTGSFVADPIAGAHAVIGILAALERRDRTGQGAHLDISLAESAMPFMLEAFAYYNEHGSPMPFRGNSDPWAAPTGAYKCFGPDDWMAIAVRTAEQWRALCSVAGIDVAIGEDIEQRLKNRDTIDRQVEQWTGDLTQYECVRLLQSLGVPAAPILHNWQLHCDPHLYARDAFIPIEHPDTGVLPYPGFPWRFSSTQPSVRMAAPRFAEANQYVFSRLLGMNPEQIAALYSEGVTADEPEGLVPVVV